MDFNYFLKINSEVKKFLAESNLLEDDSYYSKGLNSMINNRINTYVNYTNFKFIYRYFCNCENLKVLDLGCGYGDKCIFLKRLFPSFEIFGIETKNYDDPDHIERQPYLFFRSVHEKIKQRFDIKFDFYDGVNIDAENDFFDIILLYAVIEHISPDNRLNFIRTVGKKLREGGYFIITRCPRYFGLVEFITRKISPSGAHKWTLRKNDLLNLFDKKGYEMVVLKRSNNVPNNHRLAIKFSSALVVIDHILNFLHWPFSTDYFLIVRKRYIIFQHL